MALGPCKWISTITFAFLLVIFTVTLWSLESNQVQYPFAGDLTKMILGKLEGWSLGKHGVITEESKRGTKSVGPNMTSCHPSYGRKDLLVDCCPPGFQSRCPSLISSFLIPIPD
ncbi:aureusidin synthase-like [Gossypium australe]|uniref:Aureusidin synthase-like n=1 Tax=Gossypium australe TaxID=47621 RepID=A0A5B6V172_9ROSI|nr:aureusidin synthase-like [Gossypium australe]